MKNKVFQKYNSFLTIEGVKEGIEKCTLNGTFLQKEAEKCIESKRYSLAYYLLSVSQEEFIKCFLLLHYFSIKEKEGIKRFWEYYRNHEPKKRLLLLKNYLMKKSARVFLENIYLIINQKYYENIRQNSIYCDCVLPKQFIIPFNNFVYKDIEKLLKNCKEEAISWNEIILDKKILRKILEYLEKNSTLVITPSESFEKIFGKGLSDRLSKKHP